MYKIPNIKMRESNEDVAKKGESSKSNAVVNEICRDCLFWKKFNESCYVWWENKKFCTMKVSDKQEFEETKSLFDINQLQPQR